MLLAFGGAGKTLSADWKLFRKSLSESRVMLRGYKSDFKCFSKPVEFGFDLVLSIENIPEGLVNADTTDCLFSRDRSADFTDISLIGVSSGSAINSRSNVMTYLYFQNIIKVTFK